MPLSANLYYSLYEGSSYQLPPVILLHGAGGTSLTWPAEIRRLPGWRVLAIDLPGHGRSPGIPQQNITAYMEQVAQFISELGCGQAVLIGHSMGGAIALSLALAYPGQVAALGLIASGAYLGVPDDLLEAFSTQLGQPEALNILQQRAFSPRTAPERVAQCLRPLEETRYSVLYADWLACSQFDLRQEIGEINVPTWIAAGIDDQLTPLSYAHFLVNNLPDARLQLVASAGHMLLQEQPQVVSASLRHFMDELRISFESGRTHLTEQAARQTRAW